MNMFTEMPYYVNIPHPSYDGSRFRWCVDTIGACYIDWYFIEYCKNDIHDVTYYFREESDAVMFKLLFGGK